GRGRTRTPPARTHPPGLNTPATQRVPWRSPAPPRHTRLGEEMTASPLLPPGTAGRTAETEATDEELSRMTELALSRGARAIAIGRGNSPAATRAAAGFADRWEA